MSIAFAALLVAAGLGIGDESPLPEPVATAVLDTSATLPGCPVRLSIGVQHQPGFVPDFPDPEGDPFPGFSIRGAKRAEPEVMDNGQTISRIEYRLVSHLLDSTLVIPQLPIDLLPADSTARAGFALTDPLAVHIGSSISADELEAAELRPERPPVPIPPPVPWGRIALAAIAGALVAWLLWRWWKRRRAKEAPESVFASFEPPRPAHEIALEEIEALGASEIAREGPAKRFYTEACDILRRYFDGRFGVDAPDLTSEELIGALEQESLSGRVRSLVRNALREADLVKFARLDPAWSEWGGVLDRAREIVHSTTPVPEPEVTDPPHFGSDGALPAHPAGAEEDDA
ncbi:MAG: hypothetical protein CME06_01565 [Gemmatimonadetes bacterium]|nr:hypothetical protein [Gemmatimonadota bacterium]